MFFTLYLTVKLLTGSTQEVDLKLAVPSYRACMADQVDIAKYIGEHPNVTIVKWHCSPVGLEANL
jgi:hypothetical protein